MRLEESVAHQEKELSLVAGEKDELVKELGLASQVIVQLTSLCAFIRHRVRSYGANDTRVRRPVVRPVRCKHLAVQVADFVHVKSLFTDIVEARRRLFRVGAAAAGEKFSKLSMGK